MKIGLEYEGVLYKGGKIVRWADLPNKVKEHLLQHYKNIKPVDNYDCLAEVRTSPISDPDTQKILYELFEAILALDARFHYYGIYIKWKECKLTSELHNKIILDCLKEDPDQPAQEKITYQLHPTKIWKPLSTNLYRGGGLHINVSGLKNEYLEKWVEKMWESLCSKSKEWKSVYRKIPLFRQKEIFTENVFEFMSLGLELPTFHSKMTIIECYSLVKELFHTIDTIIKISKEFQK